MSNRKLPLLYGGDYNPQQWEESIWDEDYEIFNDLNINVLSLGVFTWSMLQNNLEEYDFSELDKIVDRSVKENRYFMMASATAAVPAWLVHRYPGVMRVDFFGRQKKFGQRHHFCPNSVAYKYYASQLVHQIGKRYASNPRLIAWHINNEYGSGDYCYCEECEANFRIWLQKKYRTIDNLNDAWYGHFWSHLFYDWDEIVSPSAISEHYGNDKNFTAFQNITLDYARFMSDSFLELYKMERDILKSYNEKIPATTNLMGTFKLLNYHKWAQEMDIVAWDNYPWEMRDEDLVSLQHRLMFSLKKKPFYLMEQTPTTTAWRPSNPVRRPGVVRLWSYQAIAHGSDSVMFFQMRQNLGESEKYHGAIINHAGDRDTRILKELQQLGNELKFLSEEELGYPQKSKIALVFDWEDWWAIEMTDGPSRHLNYVNTLRKYHKYFFDRNINVDIVSEKDSFENYDCILAPLKHMMSDEYAFKIRQFVRQGGFYISGYMSGEVDKNNLLHPITRPGQLKDVFGIEIDDVDTLEPNNKITIKDTAGNIGYTQHIFKVLKLKEAKAIYRYADQFYEGEPAVSINDYGLGHAVYIGTDLSEDTLHNLLDQLIDNSSLKTELEIVYRENKDNKFKFVLNHSENSVDFKIRENALELLSQVTYEVGDELSIPSKDVLIFKIKKRR